MCGNKGNLVVALGAGILMLMILSARGAWAGGRKVPVEFFKLGLNVEPGFKFIGGIGFSGNSGILLKFKDRVSIIPHFGMYPYTEEEEYTDYTDGVMVCDAFGCHMEYPKKTRDKSSSTFNAGATIRIEFPKKIVTQSTKFEYDVDKQEFRHYYYHTAFRPYVQFHLGTFLGAGGGVLYNLYSILAVGAGVDLGVNVTAEDNIFGIVAPKLLVITSL